MPAPHPRMHGLTHVPGGPDPIPGLTIPGGAGYADVVTGITDLVAYWRMGEPSGNQLDYAQNPAGDKPLILQAGATGGTYDVAGAPVDPAEGAYQQNYNMTGTSGAGGDYWSANDTGARWGFPTHDPFTAACWLLM